MSGIENFVRRQNEIIRRVGWAVVLIHPTAEDPDTVMPYAYTVGLTARFLPEFLITGLPLDLAHGLLNDMAERALGDGPVVHGTRVQHLLAGYDAVVVDGRPTERVRPAAATARYGAEQVRLQQIVWPDQHGMFPWQQGCTLDPDSQPLTGTL
ncbi:DUF4262 domain-containing protein [Dactylosporangium sp. NPDC051485]|uniref:DUF4262 domain-containing protein n=1 Tax=Dactylosporangium sp. NPDC051485 TaxID=3154846 RepID=UPI00342AB3DD